MTAHVTRARAREPHYLNGWLIFTTCLAVGAAVYAFTPSPPRAEPGPVSVQAGIHSRAAVVSAPAPAVADGGDRPLGTGLALLTVVGLVFVLISHDLYRKPGGALRTPAISDRKEIR